MQFINRDLFNLTRISNWKKNFDSRRDRFESCARFPRTRDEVRPVFTMNIVNQGVGVSTVGRQTLAGFSSWKEIIVEPALLFVTLYIPFIERSFDPNVVSDTNFFFQYLNEFSDNKWNSIVHTLIASV